jgi:hypothetical protein
MAIEATLEREKQRESGEVDKQLKDKVVSKIVEKGCACATDIAGLIGAGTLPQEVLPVLVSLEKSHFLRRREKDKDDPRVYNKYQDVYELAR